MNKLKLIAAALLCSAAPAFAQESHPTVNIKMDARVDFTYDQIKGQDSQSGFHGRYLDAQIDGTINDKWSYSWRQRFNKFADMGNDVFSATDWIHIDYRPVQAFSFSAGKQVVWMGGYEYDASPIDVLFASNFWNNIACYQFGASATWHSPDERQALTLQVTNSPFQRIGASCYAYNLYWTGNFGAYSTIWSANVMEYRKGSYATFLALGNQLDLGPVRLQADVTNCATDKRKYWFGNFYVSGKVEYKAAPWLTIMAKGGYDRLNFVDDGDGSLTLMPGNDVTVAHPFYGGGFEFYPMRGSRNLRIHAVYNIFHDNDGVRDSRLSIGVAWKVNVYNKQ